MGSFLFYTLLAAYLITVLVGGFDDGDRDVQLARGGSLEVGGERTFEDGRQVYHGATETDSRKTNIEETEKELFKHVI